MFDKLSNFVASSNFTKMLAAIFLFVGSLALLGMFCIMTLRGEQVPALVLSLLSTALGVAASILGVHLGAIIGAATPGSEGLTASNQRMTVTTTTESTHVPPLQQPSNFAPGATHSPEPHQQSI